MELIYRDVFVEFKFLLCYYWVRGDFVKPFYWIDVTEKKKNVYNIDEFKCWQVSREAVVASAFVDEKKKKYEKKARLPLPLRIIKTIMWITLFISVATLPEAGGAIGWLLLLIAICGMIIFILSRVEKKRLKKYAESEEWARLLKDENDAMKRSIAEIEIPENGVIVELLSGAYKVEKGEYNLNVRRQTMPVYSNLQKILNLEDGNLYITTYPYKYCVPDFKPIAIERVDKKIGYLGWHKSEKYNSPAFSSYNIRGNSDDVYTCKWYYVLHFEANGEKWRLFFPPYELSSYEKLTGLKAK